MYKRVASLLLLLLVPFVVFKLAAVVGWVEIRLSRDKHFFLSIRGVFVVFNFGFGLVLLRLPLGMNVLDVRRCCWIDELSII